MTEQELKLLLEQVINDNGCKECGFNEIAFHKAVKSVIAKKVEEAREDLDLLKAIAFYALVVMTELEQDGDNIVGHLLDCDDNPGQALRTLLKEYNHSLKNTAYDFLSKDKQIQTGGYKDVEELIALSKYIKSK